MKQLNILVSIMLLIALFSCKQSANNTEPPNAKALLIFPMQVQGKYLSQSDSAILKIDDNVITKTNDLILKIHLNQLTDNVVLVGDSIIDNETNERFYVKHEGDSLIGHYQWMDTLFQISQENVLKESDGDYFLNISCDNKSWDVWKLKLTGKQLKITNITTNNKNFKAENNTVFNNFLKYMHYQYGFFDDFKIRDGEVFIRQ